MEEDGLPCRCGKHGCLETIASARGVVERARLLANDFPDSAIEKKQGKITLGTLQTAFLNGDPLARKVVREAGHYLGTAIAGLISTLNIQKFILIGEMTQFGQPWLEAICEKMSQGTLSKLAEGTSIEIGRTDSQGALLGASALLLLDSYALLFMQQASL